MLGAEYPPNVTIEWEIPTDVSIANHYCDSFL